MKKDKLAEKHITDKMQIQLGFLSVGDQFKFEKEIWEVIELDQSGSASGGPGCKNIRTKEIKGISDYTWVEI